jgi:hypothetical protein
MMPRAIPREREITVDVTVDGRCWTRRVPVRGAMEAGHVAGDAKAAQAFFDKAGIPAKIKVRS